MTLDVDNLVCTFGGNVALDDVSISLTPGAVVGLIGPNGAGKSTLINCITRLSRPRSGRISLDGTDLLRKRPDEVAKLGLARTFQTPRVHPNVSVRENAAAAFYLSCRSRLVGCILRLPTCVRDERRVRTQTAEIAKDFGFHGVLDQDGDVLPTWGMRLLDMARLMALEPRYALLDEPAAGLDRAERLLLAGHISALAKRGVGVLLVEHNFQFVAELATSLVVLHQGRVLATGEPDIVLRDQTVRKVYIGSSL